MCLKMWKYLQTDFTLVIFSSVFKHHGRISVLWFIYFAYYIISFHRNPEGETDSSEEWLKKRERVKLDKLTGAKFSLGFKVYQAHACLRFRNVKTRTFIILLCFVCVPSARRYYPRSMYIQVFTLTWEVLLFAHWWTASTQKLLCIIYFSFLF